MRITDDVMKKILSSFPDAPPEHGGILGGQNGVVSVFHYDRAGSPDQAAYEPDTEVLNSVIEQWNHSGISFYGIVHSHMENQPTLSEGDLQYIRLVMQSMDIGEKLYFPIVLPGRIIPFAALKTADCVNLKQEDLDVFLR